MVGMTLPLQSVDRSKKKTQTHHMSGGWVWRSLNMSTKSETRYGSVRISRNYNKKTKRERERDKDLFTDN